MSGRQRVWMAVIGVASLAGMPAAAGAQALGTFRWQFQPYCNVVTLAVTQHDGVFRLEGTDDQCGNGADQASAVGTGFQNPDGTIGFGLTIVNTPGGAPVHIDAALAAGAFGGTWRDSAGASGDFTFTPGAGTGGTPRPRPTGLPAAIQLRSDGGFVATATGDGTIPATGPGDRMMWHAGRAAFRAGTSTGTAWDDANIGLASSAFGQDTKARGAFSTAFGLSSEASGVASTALGYRTIASGANSLAGGDVARATGLTSIALGTDLTASGTHSVALGYLTVSSGVGSTAMGVGTTASGSGSTALGNSSLAAGTTSLAAGSLVAAAAMNSVALGRRAVANPPATGSFVFGDASSGPTNVESTTPNQFLARFAGGYVLWSTSNTVYPTSPGVQLAPGASAWSSLSDVNSKEHFRELSGDEVLTKLAAMPVRTWNYKAQDAAIRHVGPTAQDFHAAFGLGEDERRISTIDADGIALAGVKALEARTRALSDRAERLERENGELRSRLEREQGELRARLDQLERLLEKR